METLADHVHLHISSFLEDRCVTSRYAGNVWLLLNKQIAKIQYCRCFYLAYMRHLLILEPNTDRKLARIRDRDISKLRTIITQVQVLLQVVVPSYSIFPYSSNNQPQYISWTPEMKKCPVEVNCYILKQTLLGNAQCRLRTGTTTEAVYTMPLEVDEMGRIIQTTSQTGYISIAWEAIQVIIYRTDVVSSLPSQYRLGETHRDRHPVVHKLMEDTIKRINQPDNLLGAVSIL